MATDTKKSKPRTAGDIDEYRQCLAMGEALRNRYKPRRETARSRCTSGARFCWQ